MEKTRYPQLSQYSTRLATFVYSQFFTNNQALANLGFFYKGQGDRVCCYECGITLTRWRKDDDPLLEHVRSSPDCRHLATIIDPITLEDYKAQFQKITAIESGDEATGVEREPQKRDVEPDLNTPAALAVLDFGYSRQAVKMAIEEVRQKGQTILTANGILQVLISFEDKGLKLPSDDSNKSDKTNDIVSERKYASSKNVYSDETLTGRKSNETQTSETRDKETLLLHKKSYEICHLLEENDKLTMKMMCKRCRERQRNVLLLPCAHFCLCEQCSKEVSLCPECWKPIKERVKTYIS